MVSMPQKTLPTIINLICFVAEVFASIFKTINAIKSDWKQLCLKILGAKKIKMSFRGTINTQKNQLLIVQVDIAITWR